MEKIISSPQRPFLLTAFILWFGHFFVDLMIGIWPVYKTIAHLDLAKAGFVSTICAFVGEGLQLLFGSLSDRGYRKLLVIVGILSVTASTFLAYTQDFLLLSLLFLFTCLGSGAFHPAAASWMSELTSKRKGLFITIFASGGMLGMALSHLIFYHVFYSFNGHTTLLAIPLVLLAFYIAISKLSSPSALQPANKKQSHFSLGTFKDFFRRKELTLLYVSQVCNQSIFWGLIFLLPDILSMREFDQWISFGGGHLSLVLGAFFMLVPSGYLADRYSCRLIIMYATGIALVLFYLFLFIPIISNTLLLILLFFLGASLGIVNPLSIAFGNKLVPENPGLISAFLMGLVWCISEGIGQGGGGFLATLFQEDGPAKALSFVGILFFVGFAAIFNVAVEPSSTVMELERTQ
jgi:MFS transporter, FSR family, fosmidomycin resistance protein